MRTTPLLRLLEDIMEDKKDKEKDSKFAKPDSQAFRAVYVQRRRKKRKAENEV